MLHLPVEKSGEGASAVAAAMPGSWRWNNNELCVHSMRGMRYSLLLVARGVAPYISIGGRPDTDYLARRTVTTVRDALDAATERPPCLLTGRVTQHP